MASRGKSLQAAAAPSNYKRKRGSSAPAPVVPSSHPKDDVDEGEDDFDGPEPPQRVPEEDEDSAESYFPNLSSSTPPFESFKIPKKTFTITLI